MAWGRALLGCAGGMALSLAGCALNTGGGSGTTTAPVVTVSIAGGGQVRIGMTAQMTASVTNTGSTAVTWQVNGVTGGSASAGTISGSGLYTAPAAVPSPNAVNIKAISQASTNASATVVETVLNPIPAIASATAVQTGTGAPVLFDVRGTNFVSGSQIQVGGVSLATTVVSGTELQASATEAASVTTVQVDVLNPNPGSASSSTDTVTIQKTQVSFAAAARLLDQATFGPTLTDIAHVQSVGLDAYLNEQFADAPTIEPDVTNPPPTVCATNITPCQQSEWWQAALTAPDQLRQRVAFAFSEMFVISTNSVNAASVIPFQNMLATDAFGNFSTMLHDVTLSTGMGAYLNMLNSAKPATGQIANENYAREAMQLFTIGLNLLNADGSPQLDSNGNMIPAYTQAQVQAFARAYTGWTYASATGGTPASFPNGTPNYDAPMALVEAQHDLTAKTLLNSTLPAGQNGTQDLAGALSDLFNHPNVGPFVCGQLIQHLVTSDPSPAYVARISTVFANNGNGVRGDLKAVIRAILEDTEARAGDTDPTAAGGHLREPILYLTDVMRALGYVNVDATGYYGNLSNYSGNLSQKPYAAGSVFNFFPPDYIIPGTTTVAPEFSLENTASAVLRLTLANSLVYNGLSSSFSVNLSATSPLGVMAANPTNLVNQLNLMFMHGQMPAAMATDIVNSITPLTDMGERVRVATYLVITSSLYKVEH
jgi:uncharacterized protein (DUF1800 family)